MPWRRAVVALSLAVLGGPVAHAAGADAPTVHAPIGLWRLSVPGWGEPASDGASTYVLTRAHELVAVETANGDVTWRAPTGGPGEAPWGSVVRIEGTRVIVGDDAVVAFDRDSGQQVWRFVPPAGSGAGPYLGESRSGLVVLGSPDGHLYAVDAQTGRLRWMRTVATAAPTTVFAPTWIGERIVASFTTFGAGVPGPGASGRRLVGGVIAFDAAGRCLWRKPLAAAGAGGPPVEVDGAAVVAQTDGRILAFQVSSGRRLWSLPRQQSRDPRQPLIRDVRALAASGSRLVTGSLTGSLVAYDVTNRQERWRYDDGPDGAAPLRIRTDGRTVYAPFTNGVLVAIDLDTGRERWRTGGADGALPWPPSIAADAVIAVGDDAIVAFAPEGTQAPPTGADVAGHRQP